MAQKIKVGAVSYLNTKPLIYGIEQGMMKEMVDLVIEYPSKIAAQLLNNEIDIGLVPIAILPELKEYHIISEYGVACDGEVASVCLFSDVPVGEIKRVLLDYQSRTSVELLKILLKEYWKISPDFIDTKEGFESEYNQTTAALIIGDRALRLQASGANPYIYDLGLAWKQLTGLPFVFAMWVSNKKLPDDFIQAFNAANKAGLDNITEVIRLNNVMGLDLYSYYSRFIKFRLNEKMIEAKSLFLNRLNKL